MAIRTLDTIDTIIIHCSDTPENRTVTVEEIDQWHRKRGFDMIGYHYFIDIDGNVHQGRTIDKVGAHAKGKNTRSIGICYAGGCNSDLQPKDTLTELQQKNMTALILALGMTLQKPLKVIGHNQVSDKACPSFDVEQKFFHVQAVLELCYA
jgi:N-acetylmuramoyl-L-alanine amidase